MPEMDEERPFDGRFPDRIGDYRIVRPLGEGGMGVVFLAIREGQGFEQTVALKLLRGGLVDPRLVQRLEEERRILARLEHPGIARLVDGGVTTDGQPYYAMEYVRGDHLLHYCDQNRLGLEDRLELFRQVCDAVHHAHQQLVVHRDLKPSNVLVTPEGRVKLVDFGIARTVQEVGASERTAPWGTVAYASPEQVAGGSVSTLSDIYSLGVLLCELVAGYRPSPSTRRSPDGSTTKAEEDGLRRPSDLLKGAVTSPGGEGQSTLPPSEVAFRRKTTTSGLTSRLRGDLDAIVLKAMATEPSQRYGSAWALSEDLLSFLEVRPVTARGGGVGYVLRKFVRRHRTLVGAAVALLTTLSVGVVSVLALAERASTQRDLAELEAGRARQVTALMTEIFRLGDPSNSLGDTIGVRQVLEEGVRRVEESLGEDPALQATLLLELARVHRNLGLLPEAERLGAQALTLRERNEAGSLAHADALGFQGLVLRDVGRSDEAVDHLERSVRLRDELLPAPDTVLATLLTGLGWQVRARGEHERAAELFERALDIQRRLLGGAHPAVATSMLGLASAFHDQGRFDESEALFRQALASGTADATPVVATALVNLGMIRRLREEYRDAESLLRAGLEMRLRLYDPEHPDVLEAREQLGICLSSLGRFQEAESLLAENLEIAMRVLGEEHERTRGTREGLAFVDHSLGRFAIAAARMDSVIFAKTRAHGGDHSGVVYSLIALGDVLVDADQGQAAEVRYREALAMGERLGGTQGVYGALAREGLARAVLSRGDLALADSLSNDALRVALESLREDHRYVLSMQRTRAEVALAAGDARQVESTLATVLQAEERVRPHPHPRIGLTLALIGDGRAATGDRPGAESAWRQALVELAEVLPDHPLRLRISAALTGRGP
jgi:serine/threonine-protein kinase